MDDCRCTAGAGAWWPHYRAGDEIKLLADCYCLAALHRCTCINYHYFYSGGETRANFLCNTGAQQMSKWFAHICHNYQWEMANTVLLHNLDIDDKNIHTVVGENNICWEQWQDILQVGRSYSSVSSYGRCSGAALKLTQQSTRVTFRLSKVSWWTRRIGFPFRDKVIRYPQSFSASWDHHHHHYCCYHHRY